MSPDVAQSLTRLRGRFWGVANPIHGGRDLGDKRVSTRLRRLQALD